MVVYLFLSFVLSTGSSCDSVSDYLHLNLVENADYLFNFYHSSLYHQSLCFDLVDAIDCGMVRRFSMIFIICQGHDLLFIFDFCWDATEIELLLTIIHSNDTKLTDQ